MLSIINSLKNFSPVEINRFKKFLNSSYYNNSDRVKALFKEIVKYYPSFDNDGCKSNSLVKKLFPNKTSSDSTFRNIISDLQTQVEEFLVIEELNRNEFDKNILLLKSLIRKNNNKVFSKYFKKTYTSSRKEGFDGRHFFLKSRLELLNFNNNIQNRKEKSSKNVEQNSDIVISYIISLICYVVSEIIDSHLKIAVQETKYKIKRNSGITRNILDAIDFNYLISIVGSVDKNIFFLQLYHNLFLTFENFYNKEYYLKYRSLVNKYNKRLSKDELSYHYSMLISYCVIHNSLDSSGSYYNNELFGIYNIFLKDNLYLDRKSSYINEDLFRNIFVLGIKLKRFDWVKSFVLKYIEKVHPTNRENVRNLAMAEYHYHYGTDNNSKSDLNKAFEFLKDIKEESFNLKYDIKMLYLMLYFDLGYTESLLSQIKNYRQFLWRNKLVPTEIKKKLNKFLNILEKLVFVQQGDPNIDLDSLFVDTLKIRNFDYLDWVQNKIQNLSKPSIAIKQGLGN